MYSLPIMSLRGEAAQNCQFRGLAHWDQSSWRELVREFTVVQIAGLEEGKVDG